MSGINTGRVALGGIAAGVVINVVESVMNMLVLASTMEEMVTALNLPAMTGASMGGFVLMAFLMGLLIVWTYAAIRPRFGAGPATALKAGAAVWAAFYVMGVGANWLMGIISLNLYLITLAYALPMMLGAAWVGGLVYTED